jgi:cytochrome P450
MSAAASGVGLALAAHLFAQVFEPPIVPTLRLHVFGFFGLTAWLWKIKGLRFFYAVAASSTLSTTYVLTLASSMAIYRLYLHRLRRYPGLTLHKLTMFSWMQIDWQGKRPAHTREMHAKYGAVVRIGPRELSIADHSAARAVYGSKCTKGPWYTAQSASPATTSLQSEVDPSLHAARRTKWASALSSSTSKGWESTIAATVHQLTSQLRTASKDGVELDLAEYIAKFTLDCASLFATGTSLNLLEESQTPPMIESLNEGIQLLDTVGHLPCLMEAVRLIPSSTREFDRWVSSAVQTRMKDGSDKKAALIDHLREDSQSSESLIADASLFIRHGSSATRRILVECIRRLIKRPRLIQRLEKEIHNVFGKDKSIDSSHLRDECPFLNACISETLRLYPPVPNGPQRVTPSQGLRISDKIQVPGNIIVSVPTYTLHRDAAKFSSPDDFDPTRWILSERKATKHQLSAYRPFGDDLMGCIGKDTALIQCRLVLASLFQSFSFTSAASDSEHETKEDHLYTFSTPPCLVKLVTK